MILLIFTVVTLFNQLPFMGFKLSVPMPNAIE